MYCEVIPECTEQLELAQKLELLVPSFRLELKLELLKNFKQARARTFLGIWSRLEQA